MSLELSRVNYDSYSCNQVSIGEFTTFTCRKRTYGNVDPQSPGYFLGERCILPLCKGIGSCLSSIHEYIKTISIPPVVSASKSYVARASALFQRGDVCGFEVESKKVLADIPINSSPTAIATTPDGNYLYAANKDGTVSKIDAHTNSIVATISVGGSPIAIVMTSDGTKTLVLRAEGQLSIIDIPSDTVAKTVPICLPKGMALTPDNLRLYITCPNNQVIDFAMKNSTVLKTIGVGSGPLGIAVTADGHDVYAANFNDNTLSHIKTSNDTVSDTIKSVPSPSLVAITPDDKTIYVTSGNNIVVVSRANNKILKTVPVGNGPAGIAFTDDGLYALVINSIDKTVSVIETSNHTVVSTIVLDSTRGVLQGVVTIPDKKPTNAPSETPTNGPTLKPSNAPTHEPSNAPTFAPSKSPTDHPTLEPSKAPTFEPSQTPTLAPSESPTENPTSEPSHAPTHESSKTPTLAPSESPTLKPSNAPTLKPSKTPTLAPSESPTQELTNKPTPKPSHSILQPSNAPTLTPTPGGQPGLIAGLCIGIIFLIAFGIFFVWRYFKKKEENPGERNLLMNSDDRNFLRSSDSGGSLHYFRKRDENSRETNATFTSSGDDLFYDLL